MTAFKRKRFVVFASTAACIGMAWFSAQSLKSTESERPAVSDLHQHPAAAAKDNRYAWTLEVAQAERVQQRERDGHQVDRDEKQVRRDLIQAHFHAVGDMLPGAEKRYQDSLRVLRAEPQFIEDLKELFVSTRPTHFNQRWLIMDTMSQLDVRAGVELYKTILDEGVLVDKVAHSMPNPQRMVQFAAVDHLARAASAGDHDALRYLRDIRNHPEIDVAEYAKQRPR